MSGDYSRKRFNSENHYQGVLRQQGRVDLDADWNEYVDLQDRRWRSETIDVIGPCGVHSETPDGFKIAGTFKDLTVGQGRIYVDGLLAENHGADRQFNATLEENYGLAPISVNEQPYSVGDLIVPENTRVLVYLDVWRREVTYLQEPRLIEPAVNVDTTTRAQTAWQIKIMEDLEKGVACQTPLADLPGWPVQNLSSAARLTTSTVAVTTASDDPCLVPPSGGYRGLENHLYRVEVHDIATNGAVRVKWSRENAHVATNVLEITNAGTTVRVASLGRDDVLRFENGNWVEITSDKREFEGRTGNMRKVTVNETDLTLSFEGALDSALDVADQLRVIRWDQSGSALTFDGLIELTAAKPSFLLEHGIQIELTVLPGGSAQVGDYWCFAARTAEADIERLDQAPPLGIHHHFCKLAIIDPNGVIQDCRPAFPALTEMTSLFYLSGDGQETSAGLPVPQPLQVGVARGQWPVSGATVRFEVVSGGGTLQGTSLNLVDVVTGTDGVASCTWTLGSVVTSQQVLATLQDSAGGTLHLPIRFNATIGLSGLEAGVHVKGVTLTSGEPLENDSSVPANQVAEGLSIVCDAEIERGTVRNRPTCFVMLDLPYPLTESDQAFWNTSVIGYLPMRLAATADTNQSVITWTPTEDTKTWLIKQLFPLMEKSGLGTQVLAHLTLLGNFIWQAGEPEVWIDGDLFGIREKPGDTVPTAGRWPTGDGRRGGDLHMWFWLVQPEEVAVTIRPKEAKVVVKGEQDFTITVTGTANQVVKIDPLPPLAGTIEPVRGKQGVWAYKAPQSIPFVNPVQITAKSDADSTKSDTTEVTIKPLTDKVTVTIQPAKANILVGEEQEFTVTVEATADKSVEMSLNPPVGAGTVEPSKKKQGQWTYRAPTAKIEKKITVEIKATSQADPTQSGVAKVTLDNKTADPQPPSRSISQKSKKGGSGRRASGKKIRAK